MSILVTHPSGISVHLPDAPDGYTWNINMVGIEEWFIGGADWQVELLNDAGEVVYSARAWNVFNPNDTPANSEFVSTAQMVLDNWNRLNS